MGNHVGYRAHNGIEGEAACCLGIVKSPQLENTKIVRNPHYLTWLTIVLLFQHIAIVTHPPQCHELFATSFIETQNVTDQALQD